MSWTDPPPSDPPPPEGAAAVEVSTKKVRKSRTTAGVKEGGERTYDVVVPPGGRGEAGGADARAAEPRRTPSHEHRDEGRGRASGVSRRHSIDDDDAPVDAPPRPPRRYDGPEPSRHQVRFADHLIDADVAKVVRRLVKNGYEGYLVGGCVRDLLLGRSPKDFDVATSAKPEQVRALFRNSRVIGRRFRLVHVLFHGGKVIEVATFRRNPKDEAEDVDGSIARAVDHQSLLIRNDNVFGVAHEDAERRDFTINGLFYDVETGEILDWVGGMDDVRRRAVHTIGDPEVRFHEDPIRILRALKFAGRLDLGIAPEVYDAIVLTRRQLELAARPRLSEEILRLLRGGAARRTIFLAWETGVLDVLLPELSSLLYDGIEEGTPGWRVFRHLAHADRRAAEGVVLDDATLWSLLLLEPLKEACDGARDRGAASADFLEPVLERLAVPRRFVEVMRRVMAILPRVVAGKGGRYARGEFFDVALEVAAADLAARGETTARLDALRAAGRLEGGRPGEGDRGDDGDAEEPRRGSSPPKDGPRANDVRRRVRIMPRR